nr:collagen-like protein [Mimivirus sp.]
MYLYVSNISISRTRNNWYNRYRGIANTTGASNGTNSTTTIGDSTFTAFGGNGGIIGFNGALNEGDGGNGGSVSTPVTAGSFSHYLEQEVIVVDLIRISIMVEMVI